MVKLSFCFRFERIGSYYIYLNVSSPVNACAGQIEQLQIVKSMKIPILTEACREIIVRMTKVGAVPQTKNTE